MQPRFQFAPPVLTIFLITGFSVAFLPTPTTIRATGEPKDKITHAFLATGGATYIVNGDGKIAWQYPLGSRDGWALANGNVLLALSQSKKYPRRRSG